MANNSTKGMRKTIHKGKNDAKGRGFALYRSTMRFWKNKRRKLEKLLRQHPNNLELISAISRVQTMALQPRHARGRIA